MADPYWQIFASEVPSDLGIEMTDEQVEQLARALEGAHENYGTYTGRDIADANWRASHDEEMQTKGAAEVLRYIEARVAEIDSGPARCFNYMSDQQKIAMHEIFQARSFLRKQGVPVGV